MSGPDHIVASLLGTAIANVAVTGITRRGTRTITTAVVGPDGSAVVLKTYGPADSEGDGTWAAQIGRQLEECGMRAPASARVATTLGVRPGALLCALAPGRSWLATVGTATAGQAAEAIGGWLHTLQSITLDLPASTTRGVQELTAQTGAIDQIAGSLSTRLARASQTILAGLAAPQPLVTSHGNLHPDNLFVDELDGVAVVTAIDLDTVAAREAAFDLGYGVAQLLVRSRRRPGLAHGAAAAQALLGGYRKHGGMVESDRIVLQAARGLLQAAHYEAVAMRGGHSALQNDLALVEAMLDDGLGALPLLTKD